MSNHSFQVVAVVTMLNVPDMSRVKAWTTARRSHIAVTIADQPRDFRKQVVFVLPRMKSVTRWSASSSACTMWRPTNVVPPSTRTFTPVR